VLFFKALGQRESFTGIRAHARHYMVHSRVHSLTLKAGELIGKLMRILQNQQYWQRVVDSISNSWGQARHSIRKNGYSTNSDKYVKALPYPLLLSFGVLQPMGALE
jgi:hypothetical protein